MATHRRTIQGDADALVAHLDAQIVRGSITTNVAARSDQRIGEARMLVRTYERYSASGGNRVSLHVAVLAVGTELAISVMTAGGSEAMFWKVNTFGEKAFLAKAGRGARLLRLGGWGCVIGRRLFVDNERRLYCGHAVERAAHRSHRTVHSAFGGAVRCIECGCDPATVVDARALGVAAEPTAATPRIGSGCAETYAGSTRTPDRGEVGRLQRS